MRQVVLDTETTGLSHELGHRIIEIGCVELLNRRLTGKHFHVYLNPGRAIDAGAQQVHGISNQFLADKPIFKQIVNQFIEFIQGAELIIHNATFDIGFLNAELKLLNWALLMHDYCGVVDTLRLAKTKHPGQKNNLDALCKRYNIDNSKRNLHGALLDAEILALVYLAMTGGQTSLFGDNTDNFEIAATDPISSPALISNTQVILPTSLELQRHQQFIKFLAEQSGVKRWAEEEAEVS